MATPSPRSSSSRPRLNGPNDPVLYPRIGQKVDWENQLVVVIGRRCKYVEAASAREVIAGDCMLNDMADRHWQTDSKGAFTLITPSSPGKR